MTNFSHFAVIWTEWLQIKHLRLMRDLSQGSHVFFFPSNLFISLNYGAMKKKTEHLLLRKKCLSEKIEAGHQLYFIYFPVWFFFRWYNLRYSISDLTLQSFYLVTCYKKEKVVGFSFEFCSTEWTEALQSNTEVYSPSSHLALMDYS